MAKDGEWSTVSASDSGSKGPGFESRARLILPTISLWGLWQALLLAGEERSLDEWGKIRLFEVGPQVYLFAI